MKRFNFYIIIIIFCSNLNFSQSLFDDFNRENISANEIIANVDAIQITAEEFFYSYEFGPSFPKKVPNSKSIHLKYMIQEKLLALEGLNIGKVNNLLVENVHNDIVGDLATEELFRTEILGIIKIDTNEIEKAIEEKLTEVEIKWIFTAYEKESEKYYNLLENNVLFDSLFYSQINDSVYFDQRSLKTSLFDIRKKNPKLHSICDSLMLNRYSKPIFVDGGWYIVYLVNKTKDLIQTQSEIDQLYSTAINGLTKIKMDSLSDAHVHNLMSKNNPIIKREVFNLLRAYIGKFILDSIKFSEWEFFNIKEQALKKIGLKENSKYDDLILVETPEFDITLVDFVNWYKNRELHLKFHKSNLGDFSNSLENMVWRMVRDKLLISEAREKKYFEDSWVIKQSAWWKDKIAYSLFKNELLNSLQMNTEEINYEADSNLWDNEKNDINSIQKIFQILQTAKKKYSTNINYDLLDKVNVSTENNKQAIELYAAKNGGLIPRPAYPSIDNEWATWQ